MNTNNTLRRQGIFLIAFLLLQYVLGMLANLFVQFPEGNTNYQQWEYAKTQLVVLSHIILGILLLIGSLMLLIRSIRARDRVWRIASGFGFGSIILAVISGSEFVSTQDDIYSLAMAVFFITALASYGWGVYKAKG